MSSVYFLRFGSGDPRQYAGLSPTFLIFRTVDGTGVTPPPIAQVGVTSGIYGFTFTPSNPITFLADAATTTPGSQGRYVTGDLDPSDSTDIALGTTASSFGSTSVDPSTVFGYLKRLQEILEGNASYGRSPNTWNMFSRGSSTLLRTKTIGSDAVGVTKI